MRVTFLGTTVLLFDDGETQLLFDAFVTRPTPKNAWFTVIQSDVALVHKIVEKYEMDRVEGIFISHSHHDHVLDLPAFANETMADVYGSPSTLNVARGGNVPESHLHLLDVKEPVTIGKFKVTTLPSIHSKLHWYNNDLGKTIDVPLRQPARRRAFREGGSFDFLIEHEEGTYLIRPSYNYLPGELDGIQTDVLFEGITGLANSDEETLTAFYAETIDKVQPKVVVPVHWDNFFSPLDNPTGGKWFSVMQKIDESLQNMEDYCTARGIEFVKMDPDTAREF